MLRYTLAAAAIAAVLAPVSSAHAYTCMPHVHEGPYTVAGQEVPTPYYVYMVC